MSKTIIQKVKESGAKFYKAAAKQTTDPDNRLTYQEETKDANNNLQKTDFDAGKGKDTVTPADDQCKTNSKGEIIDTRDSCQKLKNMTQEEIEQSEINQGLRVKGKGDVKVNSKPVLTEEQKGSNIDLIMGSMAGRVGTRLNKSQRRLTTQMKKKLAKSKDRLQSFINKRTKDGVFTPPKEGEPGYRKYTKLKAKEEDFSQAAKNQQAQFDNVTQQMTGMRNPYVSMRMEYDRDLTKATKGGQPIKAPDGTPTVEEAGKRADTFAGITPQPIVINSGGDGGSSGNVSSFTELLANLNQVGVNTGDKQALFQDDYFDTKNIASRALQYSGGGSGAAKMLKKPSAFKMKGYGSKSKK